MTFTEWLYKGRNWAYIIPMAPLNAALIWNTFSFPFLFLVSLVVFVAGNGLILGIAYYNFWKARSLNR